MCIYCVFSDFVSLTYGILRDPIHCVFLENHYGACLWVLEGINRWNSSESGQLTSDRLMRRSDHGDSQGKQKSTMN